VVLCPAEIRLAVQDFMVRCWRKQAPIRVLGFEELDSDCKPELVGVLSINF
jgi:hypothetical protein